MKNKMGLTPLLHASSFGPIDAVIGLISYGADIHARDNDGCTPLHWATAFGCDTVAYILVSYGADIWAKNKEGKTPLDCLREHSDENEKILENIFALQFAKSFVSRKWLTSIVKRFFGKELHQSTER